MKFVKRPVQVEAVRVTEQLLRSWAERPGEAPAGVRVDAGFLTAHVETSNGPAQASVGEWLLLDAAGKWYPCTHDIFERTYDPVGHSQSEVKRLRTQLGMEGEPQLGWDLRGLTG